MRVLITGASGFIGSQLARLLVREGHELYALLRPESNRGRIQDLLPQMQVLDGDLLQPQGAWLEHLKAIQPESCFHFAWYAEPGVFLSSPLNLRYLAASLRLAEGLELHRSRVMGVNRTMDEMLATVEPPKKTRVKSGFS